MPTSEELLELAEQCAKKIEVDDKQRHIPSFSDAEEQCEDEYEELLEAIHEDEVFAPVDIQLQESLVEKIAAALPDDKRTLIVELADNHARHVWLQQEGAYHLGLAVGRRLRMGTAKTGPRPPERRAPPPHGRRVGRGAGSPEPAGPRARPWAAGGCTKTPQVPAVATRAAPLQVSV